MKVVFMGRKPVSSKALEYLVEKGIEVAVVVAVQKDKSVHWEKRLIDTANRMGIPTASDVELYDYLSNKGKGKYNFNLNDIDLVISCLFWKRVKESLIKLGRIGCVNFHPEPLPEFRGMPGYNYAIYNNISTWGVSAHFIDDEQFDTGDIIKVLRFDIDKENETAFSLEQKAQEYLLKLFIEVMDEVSNKSVLPRKKQGEGRYITKQEFEELRKISPGDSAEDVHRKVRAYWYPPFGGASIEIDGNEFTLIDEKILKEIGKIYHKE